MSATAMSEQQLKPYPVLRLGLLVAGLLVAVILAGVASYYASSDPDGLTNVAQEQGFATESESATADSPLAGYGTSGVESERLSGGIAGVTGVLATFSLAGGLLLVVRRRSTDRRRTSSDFEA
jgi:cobalt/nickel transport system permease protein/cobalt/nickel transport protein